MLAGGRIMSFDRANYADHPVTVIRKFLNYTASLKENIINGSRFLHLDIESSFGAGFYEHDPKIASLGVSFFN